MGLSSYQTVMLISQIILLNSQLSDIDYIHTIYIAITVTCQILNFTWISSEYRCSFRPTLSYNQLFSENLGYRISSLFTRSLQLTKLNLSSMGSWQAENPLIFTVICRCKSLSHSNEIMILYFLQYYWQIIRNI